MLPKFKLESTHELNGPLKKLGIARAFANSAQFGGITREAPLQISEVIQKAFIEVRFIQKSGNEFSVFIFPIFFLFLCYSI